METFKTIWVDKETWFDNIQRRCALLVGLGPNWDSEDSPSIDAELIKRVEKLMREVVDLIDTDLPDPSIYPVPGGDIQIEIDTEKEHLEFTFFDSSCIYLLQRDRYTNEMEAEEIQQDVTIIADLIKNLGEVQKHAIVPALTGDSQ